MTDLAATIAPKSDQLNADDLIAGPRTIVVTRVEVVGGEQPVAVYFEGDGGKPYKPGKSMRRVLVQMWGRDSETYAGKAMTLYRDPNVQFGGMAVGGIRISHMSHISGDKTMPLTATRGKKANFTVKQLKIVASDTPKSGATPAGAPSSLTDSAPAGHLRFAGEDFDPAAPCSITPIAISKMSEGEMKGFGKALRTLIERAPQDMKQAWLDAHADELLYIAAQAPGLATYINEPVHALPVVNDGASVTDGAGDGAPSQREAS